VWKARYGAAVMKLSQSHVQTFLDRGFVTIPNFFDAEETRALQEDVRRLQRRGFLYNVSCEGDGKTRAISSANYQLCPCSPVSALMRALPFAPKVIDAVTSLIGDEIVLQLDQIFLKPARIGKGTNWHQDNAYFRIKKPVRGTAMWIAIHDANEMNGTIRMVPHAFEEALKHERDLNSDHHIKCVVDEAKAELLELPAGGVAFFCYGTPHATGDNLSEKDRAGLAYHFLNMEETDEKFFTTTHGKGHRLPILTGPRATGGFDEYGEEMTGHFDHCVQEILRRTHEPALA